MAVASLALISVKLYMGGSKKYIMKGKEVFSINQAGITSIEGGKEGEQ